MSCGKLFQMRRSSGPGHEHARRRMDVEAMGAHLFVINSFRADSWFVGNMKTPLVWLFALRFDPLGNAMNHMRSNNSAVSIRSSLSRQGLH